MKKIKTLLLSSVFALTAVAAVFTPYADAHARVPGTSSDKGSLVVATSETLGARETTAGAHINLEFLGDAVAPASTQTDPSKKERPTPQFQGQLNINTATSAQFQLLPGVGPAIAGRILTYREKRTFADPLQLLRVKGIGRKTLEKIRPYLSLKGDNTLRLLP
jgi:competence ComEA-like helix-hairpin-helix protein